MGPLLLRELVVPFLNALEQEVLTGPTVVTSLPTTIISTLSIEWRITTQQDVRDHSQRPEVAPLVIRCRFRVADERLDHLGRHKLGTTNLQQTTTFTTRTKGASKQNLRE